LGDRAHAALGVAPGADAAVYLAEGMMEQHESGARVVGAHHVADDALEAEDALDRLALEPAVQIVADAHGHDLGQGRLAPAVHFAQAVAQLHGAPEILESTAQVGRRLQHQVAHHRGHLGDLLVVGSVSLGILGRELGDLAPGRGRVTTDQHVPTLGQGREGPGRPVEDFQAEACQLELADHLGMEQADHVGADRVLESGMELLRDRCAAHHRAPLHHLDRKAGARQVAGAGEPIMPRTDNHHVVAAACPSSHLPLPPMGAAARRRFWSTSLVGESRGRQIGSRIGTRRYRPGIDGHISVFQNDRLRPRSEGVHAT
jgi:hypothetical protein